MFTLRDPEKDRWHLLNNLGEALERFLSQHQSALKQAACQDSVSPDATEQTVSDPAIGSGERSGDNAQAESDRGANVPISIPVSGSTTKSAWRNKVEEQVACHRVARMARYKEICRLHDEGHTNKAIGAHMGMAQSTVGKFLRAQQFPERAERPLVTGKLGPFHKYIQECWDAGNRNVKQLLLQLKQLGYTGSLTMLSRDIQLLRQQSKPSCTLQAGAGKFSARQVVSILLMPDRTPEQQTLLERLTTKNALFAKARGLAEAFTALIRKRPREDAHVALGLWVADAMSSPISAVASFARGLRDDWEAVVAGLSLEWSQGPVEGAVNRIKMIKRQMFGRANFDLLRRRVLPAP